MCGISGYFLSQPIDYISSLVAMSSAIVHRGPDDEGFAFALLDSDRVELFSSIRSPGAVAAHWPSIATRCEAVSHHVGMAHVRYSIIDLSAAGHQPMRSPCGKVCLTFNGEIYNYIELREELASQGIEFRTESDTEVLLMGYLAWGDQVFSRLNGFFAVALYDLRKRAVLLARDRLGVAHLYVHRDPARGIHWASEIKALLAAGCVEAKQVDIPAVTDFVLFNRRDRGGTFWRQAEDFPPAHFVWLDGSARWNPQRYWGLPEQRWESRGLSLAQAASGLRELLCDALTLRLRADVPIAFELSGGMDSSALVGLAAGALGREFTTCTIEFKEAHSNEEPYARAVAQRYQKQIDYRVSKPPETHFWQEANDFVWLQEEPFHAPNLHTNQYLRRLFKNQGIHVVITGAAGDEMLAGYSGDYLVPYLRYLLVKGELSSFWQELNRNTEMPIRHSLGGLVLDLVASEEEKALFLKWRSGEFQLLKKVLHPQVMDAQLRRPSVRSELSFHGRTLANMTHRLMNYWLRSGAKSDYGIPIESRAPFLDYRVVEYCCQLPPQYLIHNGWHKYVLREAVKDYLPNEVTWRRRKMGFPFPYREWLFSSREVARKNSKGVDCPFICTASLFANYDDFVKVAPITLWRLLSVVLWWRRVIENRTIISA